MIGVYCQRELAQYRFFGRGAHVLVDITARKEVSMKIYVGSLSFSTTEDGLRAEFQKHGIVDEVTIVADRDTGRSRGFAFVTMPNHAEASAAIDAISGTEIDGRTVNASEARPKKPSHGGGSSGPRRSRR